MENDKPQLINLPDEATSSVKGILAAFTCREWPAALDTSSADLINDFFVPALTSAIRYDRGVGFFSSAWLRVSSKGMTQFALHGGKARWVTSPILSKEDWEALKAGDEARVNSKLRDTLERNIKNIEETLECETLAALSWMVADRILDFKLALPRNKLDRGDFHDKFGVFTDGVGNRISFNGSYNDSVQGLRNYESIKIFCSWMPAFTALVEQDAERFERLWRNEDANVRVFDLPEAAREQILKLRPNDRPYPKPTSICNEDSAEYTVSKEENGPRGYQVLAIEKWWSNSCRGILDMATGTGKTKTAMFAIKRALESRKKLLVVVLAPYKHLVEQWASECENFGFSYVRCSSDFPNWHSELSSLRLSFATGSMDLAVAISTYDTFLSARFSDVLGRFTIAKFLIPDEVHHLGAGGSRVPLDAFDLRLGLSATPRRIYDPQGTDWLLSNVGPIVYSFGIKEAIPRYLCPYDYHVHVVRFTRTEQEDFQEVMDQIRMACGRGASLAEEDPGANTQLGPLLRKRQEIIGGASNKLSLVAAIVRELRLAGGTAALNHSLFYSSSNSFGALMRELSMIQGLKVSQFTFEETREERIRILDNFAAGHIQAILAKKCLDEGMDVPATRTAFILASSSNPMEFIQRRGRVLRKSDGKAFATIHDFFVLPHDGTSINEFDRRLVERELRRALEFASTARNPVACAQEILPIQTVYNLLHLQ